MSQGLLVIVDGGKGLRAAVQAFRHRAPGATVSITSDPVRQGDHAHSQVNSPPGTMPG